MFGSERHHEVAQVLHHAADDDVLLGQLRLVQRLKSDVVFHDGLWRDLAHIEQLTIDVVDRDLFLDLTIRIVLHVLRD